MFGYFLLLRTAVPIALPCSGAALGGVVHGLANPFLHLGSPLGAQHGNFHWGSVRHD